MDIVIGKHSNSPATDGSVGILFAGDICLDKEVGVLCRNKEYGLLYNDVLPYLKNKDLGIFNLECPLTNNPSPIRKAGPNLSADPECLRAVSWGGFDVAALANNHIMDHGADGLASTLRTCAGFGMATVGAGVNLAEAVKPLILNVKNKKIGIINIAEHEFSVAGRNSAGVAPLNVINNYRQICELKGNVDIIVVVVHGGHEYYHYPSERMLQSYRFFADAGASIIVGHHAHCVSGYEIYKGVPIFYGLGNFMFSRKTAFSGWHEGIILKAEFFGKVERLHVIPYRQFNDSPGVSLLKDAEEGEFKSRFVKYSEVISDPDKLECEWTEFVSKERINYLTRLKSLSLIKRMVLRTNLCRGLLNRRDLLVLLNSVECEAHQDMSISVLRRELGLK